MSQAAFFRFGFGPAPGAPALPAPAAQLDGPDAMAARHPGPDRPALFAIVTALREARSAEPRDAERLQAAEAAMTAAVLADQRRHLARALDSETPYRERLVRFWANHFSVTPRRRIWLPELGEMIDSAIRPHVTGRFAAMLLPAVTHPAMLRYLDQDSSVGPNSRAGRTSPRGLNENLGRELLELHTLGADGPYAQADVRATALLLTGHANHRGEPVFDINRAEPGIQTVLGRRYGSLIRRETDLAALLADLAAHPATARHLAGKLARHFVSDDPPAGLVDDLAAIWRESGGDLGRVSRALAEHPAALDAPLSKIRSPFEYLVAALRALGVTGAQVMDWPEPRLRRLVLTPLVQMGQNWQGAPSPAGWPEAARDWLTPPALAARIDWAMDAPARLRPGLPDARDFVELALAGQAVPRLARLVAASESNVEGLGLVLAAPAFQRR